MAYVGYVSATPIEIPYPRPEFDGRNWITIVPRDMAATPQIPLPPPSRRPEDGISILTITWPILMSTTTGEASSLPPQPVPIPDPDTTIVPVPVLATGVAFDLGARLAASEAWRAHLRLAIAALDEEIKKLREQSGASA
jgi:hypothetical protein